MNDIRFADVVKVIVQRSSIKVKVSHEDLHGHCERLAAGGFEFSQVASGHDAVALRFRIA